MRTLLILLLLATCLQAHAATLKIATLLPDGTSWMKAMRASAKEIEERTEGRLKLSFYPGGVMGNDKSVLRKIRAGQLQGGMLTTGSLAGIYKDIQIYSLPFLFRNFEEVDHVRKKIDPLLIDNLAKKGYVSFGLSEGGFVYLMSQTPISRESELRRHKVWAPEGDQISLIGYQSMGITPIQLPLTDVLTGLQTGLIDTIGASPVGAIALQWHTRVNSLTDIPVLYLCGTLVITDKAIARLPASDRKILTEVLQETFRQTDVDTRKNSYNAWQALQKQGIEIVKPTPEDMKAWRGIVDRAVLQMGEEGAYTQKLYHRIQRYLADFRGNR